MLKWLMNKFFSPKSNFTQTKAYTQDFVGERSRNVDINKLLNRVKINNQKELKRKIICGCLSALALFTFFIVFLK